MFIKKIKDWINTLVTQEYTEDIEEEEIELPNNYILVALNENGDVNITTSIVDKDNEGIASTLGQFLSLLHYGNLSPLFLKSIDLWSSGDKSRDEFYEKVQYFFQETENNLMAQLKEDHNDDVVVDARDVFSLFNKS